MAKNLFSFLIDELIKRFEAVRITPERQEEFQALYDDYFELWTRGTPQDFEYYAAIEKVLHNEMAPDRSIHQALEALSNAENFFSFFHTYYDAILQTHTGRSAAMSRVAGGKQVFVRAVMEKVKEARASAKRGQLDKRYGFLISKAAELANDRFDVWGDKHILEMARVLLQEDDATSEGSSPYFSDEAMEIVDEAQSFLDGSLSWGLALGVTQNSPPERVVLAVEQHRKNAARFPEEEDRFLLFLRGEHPNQDSIERLTNKERLVLNDLKTWLEAKRNFPTVFRVAKAI